jgi:hypothetical protein
VNSRNPAIRGRGIKGVPLKTGTVKRVPLKTRVLLAFGEKRTVGYYDLMYAVFPKEQYPKAYRRSSNGGPYGCCMALGRAIRELRLWDNGGLGNCRKLSR